MAALALLLALWTLPLWEQFMAPDGPPGNLTAMIENAQELGETWGPAYAIREFSDSVLLRPAWVAPSNRTWGGFTGPRTGLAGSVAAFAAFVVGLGAAGWWAWRRRSVMLASALATAVLVTLGSLVTLSNISRGILLARVYVRLLVPTGLFIAVALSMVALDALCMLLPRMSPKRRMALGRPATALIGAVFTMLTVFALNTHGLESGSPQWANESAAQLRREISVAAPSLHGRGPILVTETLHTTSFALLPTAIDSLLEAGADLRFRPDGALVAQYGVGRQELGDERWQLRAKAGASVYDLALSPDEELVAVTDLDDPAIFRGLPSRVEAIAPQLNTRSLVPNLDEGRTDVELEVSRKSVAVILADPEALLTNGKLVDLVRADAVRLPSALRDEVLEYGALRDRRERAFALVLVPTPT